MRFISILTAFIAVLSSFPSVAAKSYGSATVAEVVSIYDGDTFRVNIQGYPAIIGQNVPIRINGIDTPEMRGKCPNEKKLARQAKQYTVSKLREAKTIELRNITRGKYFRIAADVYVDGLSLGELLVSAHHAVKYDGGTKVKSWC